MKDVEAANLRLADIAAAGTGVRVEKGKFSGDIDIRGVRADRLGELQGTLADIVARI